jgi:hypothetical protein
LENCVISGAWFHQICKDSKMTQASWESCDGSVGRWKANGKYVCSDKNKFVTADPCDFSRKSHRYGDRNFMIF